MNSPIIFLKFATQTSVPAALDSVTKKLFDSDIRLTYILTDLIEFWEFKRRNTLCLTNINIGNDAIVAITSRTG